MISAKTNLFNKYLQECANYFIALSLPAWLEILRYLAEAGTCIVGNISDKLPLSRTTVAQYLKELKKAGLILEHVDGVKMN